MSDQPAPAAVPPTAAPPAPGLRVYSVDEVALLLKCSTKTVEEWARTGRLYGIKPGGCWVFPASALAASLDTQAMAEAHSRRTAATHTPTPQAVALPATPARRRSSKARPRPTLVQLDLGALPQQR